MPQLPFMTVDVFTGQRFGGNPLAVFWSAEGLSDRLMQQLAAEMNLSETTFVLPPDGHGNTARVRIFNRTAEMPFAGHPNVGTAFVLSRLGRVVGDVMRFEELSGLVEVRLLRGSGNLSGAEIDAPQPLALLGELPAPEIAACLSLSTDDVKVTTHAPVRASVGVEFVIVQLEHGALSRAAPDITAYRRAAARYPDLGGRLSIFAYEDDGAGVRSRMFAPLSGTWEDPATGSANATLAAMRLLHRGGDLLAYEAVQGVEMGRESRLQLRARRSDDKIFASVGGHCIEVFRGQIGI